MDSMRYLTKSRFKMALSCPTKLFYTKKLKEYADNKIEDPFLMALAKGGFQVGELAKCYYPDGIEVEGLDYDKTWDETQKLLEQENIMLFEPAIKFNNLFVRVDILIKTGKNKKPYEQIAFQFSHHIMEKDGSYRHAGEWINATPGKFPNFDFVRALKKELENDNGSIFRYSNHENTVLLQIRTQLQESNESDRIDLISWINTITHKKAKRKGDEEWFGLRDMIDLCEIIKLFYHHPATKGSNSNKYVLPAILKAQGKPDSPYKDLPPVFNNYDRDILDLLYGDEELANGGAAMTAYTYMQFGEMSEFEREKIKEALLRYCKLDTEAMVWIYQYLKNYKINLNNRG